jgi:hypothetical protein|tara:strand:- start:6322 stop:6525 length:204 start_codon:yes stop_codon:yes gene_type:complete
MKVFINDILEELSSGKSSPKRFMIKKLKTINNNIHAVIVDIDDENTEMLVALSVLQNKQLYRLIKNN